MNPLEGLRETGGLPLFSPEGRTYSPPRRHKLHILRPAASGRSHPFRCASFSHKVNDFVGALLRRWYLPLASRALSEGGLRLLRQPPDNATAPAGALLSSSAQVSVVSVLETACDLPAQTCHRQLCRRDGQAFCPSIFSFTKEKQKKENEVNERWQFTIWKRRWSAGAQDAPQWPPPLI